VLSHACDKSPLSLSDSSSVADVIFQGEIENLQYLDDPNQTKTEPRIIVTFSVEKVWKGVVGKTITIQTTHNKSTCNGYEFKAGVEYLVYSQYNKRADNFLAKLFSPSQPTLGIKVYTGTKLLSDAKHDLAYLGSTKK